ncbi:hypothetical protein CVT24_006499 [Panaeolus cyanescens]|uniref:Uncharacterized protein n=1 Tax=Panaeolus cyanescens TaxID=181874 RepID=A0A409WIK2_9AGAR|nr:hypothetical protein CVT24_006499 [Panaeolus cyanescens]
MDSTPHSQTSAYSICPLSRVLDNKVQEDDVTMDVEEEQAFIPDLVASDFTSPDDDENEESMADESENHSHSKSHTSTSFPTKLPKIHDIAKGVCDKTAEEYHILAEQCSRFLVANSHIKSSSDFFCDHPISTAPTLICLWILSECDTVDVNNKPLPANVVRSSYSHAQKMRAAMTYTFGRVHGLSKQAWSEQHTLDGRLITSGNPSVSELVSRYMLSLHRRKVQKGDISTSARAIDVGILERLHDYNRPIIEDKLSRKEALGGTYQPGTRRPEDKSTNIHNWGGPTARAALQAIYLLAFLCLLRIDEVLKIQADQIEVDGDKITLSLWYRKTHQYGDIKPFVLHYFEDYESFLCPVRALASWFKTSNVTEGYIFRRIVSGDRATGSNIAMACTANFSLDISGNLQESNTVPMGHIPFAGVVVSIWQVGVAGLFAAYASGEDGAKSSPA